MHGVRQRCARCAFKLRRCVWSTIVLVDWNPIFTKEDIGGNDGEVGIEEGVRFLDGEVMDIGIIPMDSPGCFIFFNEVRGEDYVLVVYVIGPIIIIG